MAVEAINKASTPRPQIGPRLSLTTKALLDERCKDGTASVSDVVEAALVSYLTPPEDVVDPYVMLQRLSAIEESMQALVGLFKTFLERQEAQTKKPEIPTATYEQMYGPIEAPSVEEATSVAPPPPVPLGRWRRWFLREESA